LGRVQGGKPDEDRAKSQIPAKQTYADYFVKRAHTPLAMTLAHDPTRLDFAIAMAVRKGDTVLRDEPRCGACALARPRSRDPRPVRRAKCRASAMTAIRGAHAIALCVSAVTACEREKREFTPPAQGARVGAQADAGAIIAYYEHNAQALATGKRLFISYNCKGCHASGDGGSGPALMDDVWIYGSEPMTVYLTIYGGRPNGMPAFGGRIPENQIWQLIAYVRSLAGPGSRDAASNRDDAMLGHPPEAQVDEQKPKTATASGASSRP